VTCEAGGGIERRVDVELGSEKRRAGLAALHQHRPTRPVGGVLEHGPLARPEFESINFGSPLSCGQEIFRTAGVPSLRVAGATHELDASSYGFPVSISHSRSSAATRAGSSRNQISASSTPSILRYAATWEPNAASLAVPQPRRRPVDQHATPRPVPRPSSVLEAFRGPNPRSAGRSSAPMSPSASGAAPWGTLPSRHWRRLKAVVARLFAVSVGGVSASGCERSKGGVGQRRAESGRGVGSCCPPDRARGRLEWVAGPGPAVSRPGRRSVADPPPCGVHASPWSTDGSWSGSGPRSRGREPGPGA